MNRKVLVIGSVVMFAVVLGVIGLKAQSPRVLASLPSVLPQPTVESLIRPFEKDLVYKKAHDLIKRKNFMKASDEMLLKAMIKMDDKADENYLKMKSKNLSEEQRTYARIMVEARQDALAQLVAHKMMKAGK